MTKPKKASRSGNPAVRARAARAQAYANSTVEADSHHGLPLYPLFFLLLAAVGVTLYLYWNSHGVVDARAFYLAGGVGTGVAFVLLLALALSPRRRLRRPSLRAVGVAALALAVALGLAGTGLGVSSDDETPEPAPLRQSDIDGPEAGR